MSISAPATNPASDLELKLPATIGTAGQILKNSSTPGTLEIGGVPSMLSTSSSYEGLELQTPSGDGSGEFHIGVHQVGTSDGRTIVFKRGGSDGMDTESLRIESNGNVTTTGGNYTSRTAPGITARAGDSLTVVRNAGTPLEVNREGDDGRLVTWFQAGNGEGNIQVNGSSVSYNGGVLTRWSQIKGLSHTDKSARPTIYQGTVMSNLDDLCEWVGEENLQLNMTKISDVDGDKDAAGIFWAWDDEDDTGNYLNDFYVAMTGDMVIRVAASTTVARGDLLISAGDGTAKPQADDIIRSSTVAKITSTISTVTYADGSKAYPCVLMAC